MNTALTMPQLLSEAGTARLHELLSEIEGDQLQVIALHDPATGFACFVEIAGGMPMLWRITGPMLPAQASEWFQRLAESLAATPTPRAN